MRASIDEFRAALDANQRLVDRAGNAGMDMSDAQLALGTARDQLTLARAEVHTFDPAIVEAVVGEGLTQLTTVEASGRAAMEELRFRRRGLVVSLAFILLLVLALALKVRDLDRRLPRSR